MLRNASPFHSAKTDQVETVYETESDVAIQGVPF